MDNTLTTALYLFSALLQADAALIGLGAIFVIYKLQAEENRYFLIIQEVKSRGPGYISIATNLMSAKTDSEKADLLKLAGKFGMAKELEFVAAHPYVIRKIKSSIKAPLITISLHLVASSITLWLIPAFANKLNWLNYVAWLNVAWFALGIFLAACVAWQLVVQNLTLKEVNPDLYKAVHPQVAQADESQRGAIQP